MLIKVIAGIGLFTFHKYLKSIQSTVPLDGHGNPIPEEMALNAGDDAEYFVELEETVRLTSGRESLDIHPVSNRSWYYRKIYRLMLYLE